MLDFTVFLGCRIAIVALLAGNHTFSSDTSFRKIVDARSNIVLSNSISLKREINKDLNNQLVFDSNDLSLKSENEPEDENIFIYFKDEILFSPELLLICQLIILGSLIISFKKRQEIESLRESVKAKNPDKKINSVMVLGIGGVGKTSLIKSLSNSLVANPKIQTNRYSIYEFKETSNNNSNDKKAPQEYEIFLSDYAGEKLEDLVRGFIEQQIIPYSPMRYNSVNTLILVVDLFSPPQLPDEQVTQKKYPDEARIKQNTDYWDEKTLSVIFGMLTSSLKYLCLFINKIDLLDKEEINEDEILEIKKKFDPLFRRLSLRSSGIYLTRIVGSASTGENISVLKENLLEYSAKAK